MKKYIVIYSYAIDVKAKNEKDAQRKADNVWMNINPDISEMNVEIETLN